ncbi:bifunctional 2',3'-cyclic-nucleotide 2'-phosphodiesterase/3'-nucleotidase [Metabacillus litoralis]|uniref:Bifunctional 2',3'-cyclic-nucleotide 2'-phosphodiesterase/3'-nucleotidase n=1 Tax=Metabacillus litoralis TaxID=152268 RepID=A0A5C6VXM2_9BACI|nr:bifunctional 2',3'-cyclic-nucleotide 2'-phosphodiesterase/3'-nucleotidase [Metabacillus litoralis]
MSKGGSNVKRKIRRNMKRRMLNSTLAVSLSLSIMAPSLAQAAPTAGTGADAAVSETTNAAAPVKLRIMETTDLHANMVNFDYYSLKEDNSVGFAKTATLIKQARKEVDNSLLFDNGDLLQGNPLGDYIAKVKQWGATDTNQIYDAMNLLNYDLATYGNHEFNYGLSFLEKSIKSANFEYVNSNIYKKDNNNDPSDDVNYFDPYEIIDKVVTDSAGNQHTIKVGVIGFAPPQITQWDKTHLEGKVITHDIKETAEKFVPKMKQEGADIIVALSHSGLGDTEYKKGDENQSYQLSQVEGIDAILLGHTHSVFPGTSFEGMPNVDISKGTINGVAAVQPGNWGSHLGVIDLSLEKDANGSWKVVDSISTNRAIFDKASKTPLVDADQQVLDAVKEDHEQTIEYVSGPVGSTTSDIYSYFAQVKDDPSVQIVADAQKVYIENAIKGTEFEGLPVLSAAAPFKSGRDSSADYTEIPAGDIAIKDTASLYKYPNTVMAVKLTGAEVKEWLEWSAGQFNTIDPSSTDEQQLVNKDFPSYNFDIIDGVTYEIDVTKPARYDKDGKNIINNSERIVNLQFNGKPIDPNQEFIIASNNYRASFTPIANPGGDNIVIESPDENRQVLVDYIRNNGVINPAADSNWSFSPINADLNVVFNSAPGGEKYTQDTNNIKYIDTLESGYAKYSIDLASTETVPESDFDLTLMHTNDTHAHLENVARRVTAVENVRSQVENSILLDAGDVFSGTLFFNQYNGLADVQFMNMMGYDAMVPGNHEFDKGTETLANFVKEADFPIISSNIDYSKDEKINTLFKDEIGQPGQGGNIYPATILEVDGEEVGVFGLTTEETAILANPGKKIVFENYLKKAEESVSALKEAGVNKIVALTHLGYTYDKVLAESVDGIDVIVGGHSHTLLDEATVYNEDSEPTLVVQAQEYSNYLGRLDLSFNDEGVLEAWNDELIDLNAKDSNDNYVIAEDEEAATLLDSLSGPIEELKQQNVGKSSVFLDGDRNSVRDSETNLGNLITDGMLSKAKEFIKTTTIAIQNGGGIRASIEKGDISLGDVLTTMPFGNTLVTLDLTGAEIVESLENGVSKIEEGAGRFPQVSGLHYSFNRSLPAGERILDVMVETEDGFEHIDLNKTYTVATNAYMADGGDGYESMKKAKNEGRMKELFLVDYDVFTSHLEKAGTVNAEIEGRIMEVIDPIKPTLNTEGSTTTVTVTLDDVKKAPVNGAFPIDLSETQDLETVEVFLTAEQIAELKALNVSSIQLIRDDVYLDIPVANFGEGDATITIDKLDSNGKTLTNLYDFTIQQNGDLITTFEEGNEVTIGFGVDPEVAKDPRIFYLNEESNEWEEQESYYESEFGEVYAFVNHFSVYTVMENEPQVPPSTDPKPDNPDDKDNDGDNGSTPGDNNSDKDDKSNDKTDGDKDGKSLPNTATNSFNILLAGLSALVAGGYVFITQRKKKIQ